MPCGGSQAAMRTIEGSLIDIAMTSNFHSILCSKRKYEIFVWVGSIICSDNRQQLSMEGSLEAVLQIRKMQSIEINLAVVLNVVIYGARIWTLVIYFLGKRGGWMRACLRACMYLCVCMCVLCVHVRAREAHKCLPLLTLHLTPLGQGLSTGTRSCAQLFMWLLEIWTPVVRLVQQVFGITEPFPHLTSLS